MSKIDALFVWLVGEAHNSFDFGYLYLIEVDAGEELLNAPAYLPNLVVFGETVQNYERFLEGHAERLPSIFNDIFHIAVIHDSKRYFSSSHLNQPEIGL